MQSLEHEKALIGAVIRDDSWLPVIGSILPPEAITTQSLRQFYQIFSEMQGQGKRIDALTVQAYMAPNEFARAGGSDVLFDCMGYVPQGERVEEYARQVLRAHQQRQLDRILKQAIALNSHEGLDKSTQFLEENLVDLSSQSGSEGFRHISESLTEWYSDFEQGLTNPELVKQRFLPTGVTDYDKKFLGLRKGLNILGGRPGMAKSAYALTEALNISRAGGKVLFVSIEMPELEIDNRLISALSKVDSLRLERFQLLQESEEIESINKAFVTLAEQSIWISSVRKLSDIKSAVNRWRRQHQCDPDYVAIDYLQLVEDGTNSEYAELSKISRELMYFFKFTVGCPCRLLCQLSRGVESRNDTRPIMSDIRGSGGIEQDADVIDFIWREDYYSPDTAEPGVTEIIRRKSRQAPIGTIKVKFLPQTVSFVAYAGGGYGY